MTYSPKHPNRASAPASDGKKKKQKTLTAVVLIVLAVIVIVALVFIFAPSDGSFLGIRGSRYVPEKQDGTTNLSQYYSDGILPTSGSRHDVSVIKGGGSAGAQFLGTWQLDEVTTYEFDGQGRGIMLTAVDNYTFVYSADGGKLDIDFDIDDAMDSEYSYSMAGDKLTISRGGATYEFKKVK